MFVIDTTGSMWDDIAEAKANAAEIGQKVLSTNPDSRIGLVEYKDWDSPMYVNGESTAARVVVPLTKDFSIFNERLQALSADGGDEELPEDMLSGIALAQEANWSVPRTRDILVIGDQPAHDPECRTGLTLEALKARSSANSFTFGAEQWPRNPGGYSKDSSCLTPILGINRSANGENRMSRAIQVGSEDLASDNSQPIRISAVTNNPDMANSIKDLIDFTGGVVVSYQDAQSADAIITATANLESSPEAILSIPGFMAVGETVPMSGALSKVFVTGGMSATIDFGDGTVEKFESWDDLFDISHVYSTPGSYTVELRVFDSAGNVGIDRVDIEVMSEDGARVFDYALGEWSLSSYRTDAEPPVQSDDTSSFHGTSSLKSENIFSSLMKVLAVLSIFGGVISAIFSFLSSSRR
nr:PKD domain-containing protein [Corynebacterium marambiense]